MNYSSGAGSRLGGYGLAFAFLCLGAFILNDVYLYHASKSWPFMMGTVTSSHSSCVPGKKYNCTAEVSYAYGARTGQAQVNSGGLWYTGEWTTNELLENFREGAAVKVRVDPAVPGRARLEGAGAMDWRAGAFFLALAGFILVLVKGSGGAPGAGQEYDRPDLRGAPPAAMKEELAPKRYSGYASFRLWNLVFIILAMVAIFLVNFFLALRR